MEVRNQVVKVLQTSVETANWTIQQLLLVVRNTVRHLAMFEKYSKVGTLSVTEEKEKKKDWSWSIL